jgi:hypothetical protein
MDSTLPQADLDGRTLASGWLLPVVVGAGIAITAALRLSLLPGLPLWLDETWTAIIVNQPTWSAFWREVRLDCNPPLYYLLLALWTPLAGISNEALRAPSFFFMLLAFTVAWLWKAPGLSRDARLAWAALLFIWWPGVVLSLDARGYSLLMLISVAQLVALVRLLAVPTAAGAALWAALASAAVMTHYHALYPACVQGLLYLFVHRQQALRTWPAALVSVPALGWLTYHLPRLGDYARPDVAWYNQVTVTDISKHLLYVTGATTASLVVCAAAALAASVWVRSRNGGLLPQQDEHTRQLWLAAVSGVLALLLSWAVGFIRPTLAERYLTPMVPAILLGIVLLVRRLHDTPGAYAVLVAVYLVGSTTPATLEHRVAARNIYGYEKGAAFLMAARPDQLIFAWDHPATKILDEKSLRELGGFFFARAGLPIETVPVIVAENQNANPLLLGAATGKRPAIIWLYNKARASSARRYAPMLERQPGWRCRHDRLGPIGAISCAPDRLFPH